MAYVSFKTLKSDFACFSASRSLLNNVAPENLNVLFPLLSFTFGMRGPASIALNFKRIR